MSFETERSTIETRFRDQWLTGSPAALRTPVGWDGQKFEPPPGQSSVRLVILRGSSQNKSMGDPGNNKLRYSGVVFFQIFTPGGQGSKAGVDLADLIRPIFTNWRSGDLLFRTMQMGSPPDAIGRQTAYTETPPFYMLPVHFPFQRDENHG